MSKGFFMSVLAVYAVVMAGIVGMANISPTPSASPQATAPSTLPAEPVAVATIEIDEIKIKVAESEVIDIDRYDVNGNEIIDFDEGKDIGASRPRGLSVKETAQADAFNIALNTKKVKPLKAQPMNHVQASVPLQWLNTEQANAALNRFGYEERKPDVKARLR